MVKNVIKDFGIMLQEFLKQRSLFSLILIS